MSPVRAMEGRMFMWWGRLNPILFPWVPQSIEQYVSILFWHSMLFTFTTPLFRIFHGHWRGESSLHFFMTLTMPTWLVEHCVKIGFIHPGIDYVRDGEEPTPGGIPVKGIDLAFALHAGFALTWLLCAYIQMVHNRKKWVRHRIFGYVSAFSFCCHVGASCFNLYMDVVQHKPLPRILLVMSSMSSVSYMIKAIRAAIQKPQGWVNAHKDMMMLCFLVSIQGAGPIRMISQVQTWLGCGPVQCQNEHGGVATDCMWPYVFRMFWIQFYTMYTRGIYCKMRGDGELTYGFLCDFCSACVQLIAMFTLSYMPHNEWLLGGVLGHERTMRGSFTVVLFCALQLGADLMTIGGTSDSRHRRRSSSVSSCIVNIGDIGADLVESTNRRRSSSVSSCVVNMSDAWMRLNSSLAETPMHELVDDLMDELIDDLHRRRYSCMEVDVSECTSCKGMSDLEPPVPGPAEAEGKKKD